MKEKNKLKDDEIKEVNGGSVIVNASDEEENAEEKAIQEEITRLQNIINSRSVSVQESMRLMEQITRLLRELQGLNDKNPIVKR